MVKIKKQLINSTPNSYGNNNKNLYITVHETANTNKGAHAQAHANLQTNGNSRSANWHWQVDDKVAIQSFTHDFSLWAGGDGRGNGNLNSIHVEICVNSDGNYKQAVANAIELVKHLMRELNISSDNVVQHNHWSGKNCPRYLRDGSQGVTWNDFKRKLTNTSNTTQSKPQKPSRPSTTTPQANMTTSSIVVYLQSINQPFSMAHRKKLAKRNGINNYVGSAVQNLMLLDRLRKTGTSKPTTSKRKPKANLVIDGKWGTATTRALQVYFETKNDGVISRPSKVIKALQGLLGVKADGYLGRITITALQTKFKMNTIDGIFSKPVSAVVQELQKRLNKGAL